MTTKRPTKALVAHVALFIGSALSFSAANAVVSPPNPALTKTTRYQQANVAASDDLCQRKGQSLIHKSNYAVEDSEILEVFKLSKEERVDVMCQVRDAVLSQYALVNFKKIDIRAHLDKCVRIESETADTSRLKFGERAAKCIAGLEDTHFDIPLKMAPPNVFTAVGLSRVGGGKIIISGRYTKLMSYMLKDISDKEELAHLNDALAIGNEVLELDGIPVATWIREFVPYISGSSQLFREEVAAASLLNRNFLYPRRNYVDLTVASSKGTRKVRLPWWSGQADRHSADAVIELKRLQIPTSADLLWKYDSTNQTWESEDLEREGFSIRLPLVPMKSLVEYVGDNKNVAARMGQILRSRSEAFCYLELLTFSTKTLTPKGSSEDVEFLKTIEDFAKSCEEKSLPLIFDLRSNNGGYFAWPAQVASILAPRGSKFGGVAQSFRATKYTARMLSQLTDNARNRIRFVEDVDDGMIEFELVMEAIRNKRPFSDFTSTAEIVPKLEDGFNQPIVVLATPQCISACDITVSLLKTMKIAQIIGTHTNGTGAGFTTQKSVAADFVDTMQIFSFKIPNFLFGIVPQAGMPMRLPYDDYKHIAPENKPVVATVPFEMTGADYANGGKRLLSKALEVIKAMEITKAGQSEPIPVYESEPNPKAPSAKRK